MEKKRKMETTNELRKKWTREIITIDEVNEKRLPEDKKVVVIGELEEKDFERNGETHYYALLPVEWNKEARKVKLNMYNQPFLKELESKLGYKPKDWVGAVIQLSVDNRGKYPVLDGLVTQLPMSTPHD